MAGLYFAYLCIFYQRDQTEYNGYILYILGGLQNVFNICKPITVITLGIDRICCITLPMRYLGKRKFYPVFASSFIIVITMIAVFLIRFFPTWPKSSYTTCTSYGCMTSERTSNYYTIHRFICSGINIAVGITLFILTKKRIQPFNSNKVTFLASILCVCFLAFFTVHSVNILT